MGYNARPLYLKNPSFHSPEVQEAIDAAHERWLHRHGLEDGSILYHYTTLAGLRGILKSRALWYGHIYSLNDPMEIQYGLSIVSEVLKEQIEEATKEGREIHKDFLVELNEQSSLYFGSMFHAFVTSFCENGDLLSQWRAYSAQGGGYCLGLEFSDRTRVIAEKKKDRITLSEPDSEEKLLLRPYLRKVVYQKEEQKNLVRTYASEVAEAAFRAIQHSDIEQAFGHSRKSAIAVLALQATNVLDDLALSFKQSAFQEEQEWRLIRVVPDNRNPEEFSFRDSGNGLIPYCSMCVFDHEATGKGASLGTPQFPLRELRFGPALDPRRTQPALALLLHHTASDGHPIEIVGHTPVRGSVAPLR